MALLIKPTMKSHLLNIYHCESNKPKALSGDDRNQEGQTCPPSFSQKRLISRKYLKSLKSL